VTVTIDRCNEGERGLDDRGHGWTWFHVAPDASGRADGLPTRREPSEALRHRGEPFLEVCADAKDGILCAQSVHAGRLARGMKLSRQVSCA
jgi:hypothetical protein